MVYPSWKRYLKYLISFPLTVAFTVGTLIVILLVHANRDLMLANYFELKTSGTEDFKFSFSITTIHRQAPLKAVHVTSEHLRDPTFWVITADKTGNWVGRSAMCAALQRLGLNRKKRMQSR